MAGPTVILNFDSDISQVQRGIGFLTTSLAALPVLAGAAGVGVAGALLAAPAAFMGIGIAAAAQSEQVKSAYTSLKDHVVATTTSMAGPVEQVLIGIAAKARTAFDSIAPSLGEMFRVTAPYIDQVATGLINLTTNAMPGLMTATSAAAPLFDTLKAGLEGLGTGISGFFTNISTGAPGANASLKAVFDIVNVLLPTLGLFLGALANVGGVLLTNLTPAINVFLGLLSSASVWVSENSTLVGNLATVFVALAVGLSVVSAALRLWTGLVQVIRAVSIAWTAVQWLLNAAMAANPIGLVVIAIVALVAILVLAYNKSETFRNIVNSVWASVKSFIVGAIDTIKGAINWFASLPGLISNWFNGAKNNAMNVMNGLVGFMRGIPGMIMGALGNLGGLLVGAGRSLIDGFWRGISSMIGWVKNQVSNAMGAIRNLFPFSPAKEGPFSGRGYTSFSGKALATDFAKGITAGVPGIQSAALAAAQMAAEPFSNLGGGVAGPLGGGVPTGSMAPATGNVVELSVRFEGNTDSAFATLFMGLVRTGQIQIGVS